MPGTDLTVFLHDRRGNLVVSFALFFALIMGIAGAGLDYSRATRTQTRLQAALDAAVLAGAAQDDSLQIAAAQQMFERNLSSVDATDVTSSFSNASGILTGTASARTITTFTRLLGVTSIPIGTTSAAASGIPAGPSACIYVLDPTATQSLLVNSGADIAAPTCEIHVASKASPAAIFNAGTSLDFARICVAGTNIIDNGGSHSSLSTGCNAAANPYVGKLPAPAVSSCDFTAANYSGSVSLTPGVYCGGFNFNAGPNVTFAPGLYVIKGGDWNVDGGNWTGTGVTFYFADSSRIQFNSAVAADMTSPTSGTYAGIFMFEPDGLSKSPFVLDDSRGMSVTGLIYLPSRNMTFNSASNLTDKSITLVTDTLILDQTRWNLSSTTGGGTGSAGRRPILVK